ncbi:hypothetical protein AAE02nite_29580 [Adhaeribacter aerolatus]|uniref:DUF4468 domain-containing protein n=1 Tax=Adhaeribacter aerolatus TaxID=670289 RepID=A0A512B015_9BACT|nr:DUF4468 domain-containing protein [Adhaeribacter aerolatus]GEO05294.1 hypothetical protein AAE02nite_29580 [Adhaeribacter aerolatus]
MKKIYLMLILLIVGFSIQAQKITYEVKTLNSMLHKSSNIPNETLAELKNGESVTLLEKVSGDIYKVDYKGQIGFMRAAHLKESYSLPIDQETRKVDFTEVVEIAGAFKPELHIRAKQWIVTNFNSANAIIQMEDKEEGVIIGKGFYEVRTNFEALVPTIHTFGFTIKIYVKDNKYKYSFTNILYQEPALQDNNIGSNDVPFESLLSSKLAGSSSKRSISNQLIRTIEDLTLSLNKDMAKPVSGKSDW